MNSLTQQEQLNSDTNTRQRLAALVQALLGQAQQTIHFQKTKIQVLTLELAHLCHIRFVKKGNIIDAITDTTQSV